jgi:acyl-CoA synthetase (AMP-forming)/AMP-acid ligase II
VEVEQALMAHPAVLDCAVVGLPDPRWGERVTAIVQLHPGHDVELDDIARFVRARLGGVKAPKQLEIWPDLPRSKVGKILKADIKRTLLAQVPHDA